MFALIGAVVFFLVLVLTIIVAFGLPLGEFTMGGRYKILPSSLRSMAAVSALIQLFAIIIILQAGAWLPLWFTGKTTQIICYIFAAYLLLNTVMNLLSKSKKERMTMTPLSLTAAISFGKTAFQMEP